MRRLHLSVNVQNGQVFLRGTVHSEADRLHAIALATSAPGARNVEDSIVLVPQLGVTATRRRPDAVPEVARPRRRQRKLIDRHEPRLVSVPHAQEHRLVARRRAELRREVARARHRLVVDLLDDVARAELSVRGALGAHAFDHDPAAVVPDCNSRETIDEGPGTPRRAPAEPGRAPFLPSSAARATEASCSPPVPEIGELHLRAGGVHRDHARQVRRMRHLLPLDRHTMMSPDLIPASSAGLPELHLFDQRAVRVVEAKHVGEVLIHRLDDGADPPARPRAPTR